MDVTEESSMELKLHLPSSSKLVPFHLTRANATGKVELDFEHYRQHIKGTLHLVQFTSTILHITK